MPPECLFRTGEVLTSVTLFWREGSTFSLLVTMNSNASSSVLSAMGRSCAECQDLSGASLQRTKLRLKEGNSSPKVIFVRGGLSVPKQAVCLQSQGSGHPAGPLLGKHAFFAPRYLPSHKAQSSASSSLGHSAFPWARGCGQASPLAGDPWQSALWQPAQTRLGLTF